MGHGGYMILLLRMLLVFLFKPEGGERASDQRLFCAIALTHVTISLKRRGAAGLVFASLLLGGRYTSMTYKVGFFYLSTRPFADTYGGLFHKGRDATDLIFDSMLAELPYTPMAYKTGFFVSLHDHGKKSLL
ncbi:MAG: hypothetical protein K0R76_771 [Alphaproteobacteria bacterium]|nr:hypothetical protein [Alphaproteobacteria bacterium]